MCHRPRAALVPGIGPRCPWWSRSECHRRRCEDPWSRREPHSWSEWKNLVSDPWTFWTLWSHLTHCVCHLLNRRIKVIDKDLPITVKLNGVWLIQTVPTNAHSKKSMDRSLLLYVYIYMYLERLRWMRFDTKSQTPNIYIILLGPAIDKHRTAYYIVTYLFIGSFDPTIAI